MNLRLRYSGTLLLENEGPGRVGFSGRFARSVASNTLLCNVFPPEPVVSFTAPTYQLKKPGVLLDLWPFLMVEGARNQLNLLFSAEGLSLKKSLHNKVLR